MAHMFPSVFPMENYKEDSNELEMYQDLQKGLSDEYYVFHSKCFRADKPKPSPDYPDEEREMEADFIIYRPDKGFICLECKSAHIKICNDEWYTTDKNGNHEKKLFGGQGPYEQARQTKHGLQDLVKRALMLNGVWKNGSHIVSFHHAVWFYRQSREDIRTLVFDEKHQDAITLTREHHENPKLLIPQIEAIFSIKTDKNHLKVPAGNFARDIIIKNFLCKECNLVCALDKDGQSESYLPLLIEQVNVLNFLAFQPDVVVYGAGGTGKTLIAMERAKRLAALGEKVLFLCFNEKLNSDLTQCTTKAGLAEWIHHRTIYDFALTYFQRSQTFSQTEPQSGYYSLSSHYKEIMDELRSELKTGALPYRHIIIDEGQDFQMPFQVDVSQALREYVLSSKVKGSFCMFYDDHQEVQNNFSDSLSNDNDESYRSLIDRSECRLPLHTNCRNTRSVACTALSALRKNPDDPRFSVCPKPTAGKKPLLHVYCPDYRHKEDSQKQALNAMLRALRRQNEQLRTEDIVILTCKGSKHATLEADLRCGYFTSQDQERYRFTTVRKFKGCEAEAIILLDANFKDYDPDFELLTNRCKLFYTGASRARSGLGIVYAACDDNEIRQSARNLGARPRLATNSLTALARALKCQVIDPVSF